MVKVLGCRFDVSKFELQLCYYIHFRTNNLKKDMNPYPPSYEVNSITAIFLPGWLWL